jgi:hypothetical protein
MPADANKSSIPFAGTVTDSLELMSKVWGMSGLPTMPSPSSMVQFAQSLPQTLPTMLTPTLDLGELDKRIADLRAVEQWLNLNTSMLRTTIQSLEVQRNTIATLKSFGGTMLAAMPGATRGSTAGGTAPSSPPFASPSPAPASPVKRAAAGAPAARKHSAKPVAPSLATMPLNPAAWWGALQDQFTKVAAVATENASGASTTTRAAGASARKRRARKSG